MILSTLLLLLPQAGNLDAALKDAQSKADAGNYSGAIASLADAGVEKSGHAQAMTAYGIFKLRDAEAKVGSGRIKGLEINDAFLEAAYALEAASKTAGAPAAAFENWAEALLNGGDLGNALRAAQAGVAAHADQASSWMQKARVEVASANNATKESNKLKMFKAAVADYRKATKLDKKTIVACTKLGETIILEAYAKGSKGKPDKARKEAAKVWADALKRDQAAVDLSAMCQWLAAEAVPLLDKIDTSKGKDATMAWYKGYAEYSGQPRNWAEVRKHFEKSLELTPSMSNSWFFLAQGAFDEGVRIQQEGDQERANKAYRYSANAWGQYVEANGPGHRNAVLAAADGGKSTLDQLKWLAGKAVGHGDFDSAIRINLWITQTTQGDVEAWNNLAFLYRDSGQAAKALPAYAKAAKLSPEDPQVLNDWAVIYHYYLKTDDAKAMDLYEQAIKLAEERLNDGVSMSDDDRRRIQIGLRDARNNLAKLKKGNRNNG
jgi:tetratricopeptide (TPR) repeat protein